MSCRPTTRNKNKRHKPDETVEATSQTLRKIHSTGQVTKEDVMNMYMIWKPNCQGCRVNTKDNPNCLCGLIPPPNGSRKTGLWQKVSEIVLSLGKDPCEDLRVSPHSPAGLTNLGATCYANSILQCLYMNKSFREGIFSVELDILKEHLVLDQLARLFAQLHASKMAFIDSAPFIKTLELDNGVQQDSHEFLTLLLSLLEQCLSHSNVPKARTIVQYLFCGNVSHVTRCSKCGKESAASSNMEAFYEIELNVKGVNNLDESLDDYLAMEELHGENQYFCDSCNSRVDATRCIKLRTLPIVLNFQLKRCVFLPKTTTKKKITSAFRFPKELAMGQRMCEFSQEESIYDLSAVLLHKGTAVNSGHYVAHIKDVNTGMWWKFDDENVSNLGCHPFGEGPSIPASMSVQNGSLEVPSCSESNDNIDNRNHASVSIMQSSKCNNVVDHEETFSSCDAYMLMYNLKRTKRGGETTHMDCDASGMDLKDDRILSVNDVFLPSHLHKEMEDLNASYLHDCEKYKLKKVQELEHITERRQEVRSVLAEAPVSSPEEPYIWISTDWLRQWADNIAAPSIDNKSIQCVHGKVPVSKLGSMKRLSMKAWMLLLSKHGGGPRLSNDDCCTTCLIDWAHIVASADSYRDQRTLMKQLAEAALSGTCSDGPFYYVSRQWLQQWLRRKNVDSPCEADAGPTASIRCPHGELMPAQAAGAKRLLIPERLWIFFYECANAVRPEDPLGYSAFPSDSEPCAQCSVVLNEAACLEDTLREVRLKQRQNHEKLATGKSIALSLNCHYYLLPSSWLSNWRSHISASGKTVSSPMQPETLDSVINSLKCEKHGQLLQRPLDLTCKRGVICQKVSAMDGLTIITQNDWKLFCEEWGGTEEKGISAALEEWGGTEEKGISAALEFTNYPPIDFRGSCEEMPMLDENSSHHDSANDGNVSKRFVIKTFPVICEECIGEKASCDLMHKLSYFNEDICVCFVRGKDAPRSIVEASSTASDRDRRISKRARKTTFGNSVNLKVAGSTTLYQLKMMIWESFGVVRENQILHKGSEVLDSESATLADLNIFPGDTLWFTDSEIHEHRDIAEELVEKESVRRGEEGFRGTLLASNISSLVA